MLLVILVMMFFGLLLVSFSFYLLFQFQRTSKSNERIKINERIASEERKAITDENELL